MGAQSTRAIKLQGGENGRVNVPFRNLQITEITCAARGAAFLFPNSKCVLDVGAQSTRAIKLRENGRVKEFKSNDKSGSGGFLERAAVYLEIPVEKLGSLSLGAKNPQNISSVCAVLAESEIINHVSSGQTIENIILGVHNSLASRSKGLLARVGLDGEVTFVGGVARQSGMVEALKEAIGQKVNVSDDPDLVGAIGAALLALQRYQKLQSSPAEPPGERAARN